MLRKRSRMMLLQKIGFIAVVVVLIWLIGRTLPSLFKAAAPDEAATLVQRFYEYEQAGDFGSSWELFHPLMKERFSKSAYLQSRAHIFMQHFGVETFGLEVGEPEREFDVVIVGGAEPFGEAYRVKVTMKYEGTFGQFSIDQNCYVVKDGEEWTMLWYYPQKEAEREENG